MSAARIYEESCFDFQTLLRLARQGDIEALGALLAALTPRIKRIIRRWLGESEFVPGTIALDFFQDTCLEALRDFTSFKGESEGELVQWIGQIAVNTCRDGRRRRRAQKRGAGAEHSLDDPRWCAQAAALVDHHPGADEVAAMREDDEALQRELDTLAPQDRELIVARYVGERSFAELAAALGKSADAVRMACYRLLAELRRRLAWNRADGQTREQLP